jgi:hypothetical protein
MKKKTLAVLALAVAAAVPLAAEELSGPAALAHTTSKVLIEFTTLAKAGKLDDASAFQTERAQKRRADRTPQDRKESDAFVKDFLPAPDALKAAIEKNGTLKIDGEKAELHISVSSSTKNADGSVTASAEAMAFAFAKQDGLWRLDQ